MEAHAGSWRLDPALEGVAGTEDGRRAEKRGRWHFGRLRSRSNPGGLGSAMAAQALDGMLGFFSRKITSTDLSSALTG